MRAMHKRQSIALTKLHDFIRKQTGSQIAQGSRGTLVIEELNPAQFDVLRTVHEGFVPPDGSAAIVARDGGEIVGRVFLMAPVHVEGPWVKEDLRGHTLGYRLMEAAAQKAKECGVSKLFAYAADATLANYLGRLGYKQEPFTVWTKEI